MKRAACVIVDSLVQFSHRQPTERETVVTCKKWQVPHYPHHLLLRLL